MSLARLLRTLTLWGIPALLLFLGWRIAAGETWISANHIFIVLAAFILLISRLLLRRERLRTALFLILFAAWSGVTFLAWTGERLYDTSLLGYLTIAFLSSILLGITETLSLALLSIAAFWGFAYAESTIYNTAVDTDLYARARDLTFNFLMSLGAIHFTIHELRKSLRERKAELAKHKQAEEALRESEERFRKVFHSSPIAICITRLQDGTLLDANYAYWDLTGLDPATSLGKNLVELKIWSSAEERAEFLKKLLKKRSHYDPDSQFRDAKGQIRYTLAFYEIIQIGKEDCILSMFYDMSAQKQIMRALQESEARIRALLEAIPDMIFELSAEGIFLDYISTAENKPLLPPSEFIGRNIKEILPPHVADPALFAIRRAIETKQLHAFEYQLRVKNETRSFEARMVALTDSSVIAIVREITVRKRLELEREQLIAELEARNEEAETLRESAAIVAATLETTETVKRILEQLKRVVPYDSASVWLYQNDKAVMVGFDGLSQDAVVPGEYVLSEKEPDYALWKEDAPYVLFHDIQEHYPVFRKPSLSYIHGWMAVPLRARGKLIGFISLDSRLPGRFTAQDAKLASTYANQVSIALENARLFSALQTELEERKKLIAELEARNKEAETLRESTAIVAATLERREAIERILEQLDRVVPYDSASVQLLNDGFLEIVGGRRLPIMARENMRFPLDVHEPAYPVLTGEAPYVLFEDIQPYSEAFRVPPHDRIHAWLAIPLKVKDRVIGIIALDGYKPGQFSERDAQLALTYANQVSIALENARLFSELQAELEERKRLIAELESKNEELERFTYTVSHDLKAPLFTIRGFLGYLERDALAGDQERLKNDIHRIVEATERMQRLLNELLELSRVGRVQNEPTNIPFNELAQEAVELTQGRIAARRISVHIHPNLPTVYGDRQRLLEALQNLVDNAAKFMGDQSQPFIEIGCEGEENGNPILFVRDNGIGIAPEHHERIFGLFNKLDIHTEGTGVGLALVKRIIEVHGGRIWVRSEAGKGATFFFTLPASRQADA
ncbi:MAG TPA: ATP-binding protein [Anaerolineales bacterium]|nr:ATP-binding protein [Anaerolineales bacterium]